MNSKAVVLMSAGLDSTTNLYEARAQGISVALTLTADYGQRAASREIDRSRRIAQKLGLPHRVVELPFFRDLGNSSLTDSSQEIPTGQTVQIDDHAQSVVTAKSVWVPNRNGILLNLAAGFAEALKADAVVPGFNAEEGATFPDNTPAFMDALTKSFSYSTSNGVRVICFTQNLDKPAIAVRAKALGVDFQDIWPCYFADEKPCGSCESCQRDKRAFKAAGIDIKLYFKES